MKLGNKHLRSRSLISFLVTHFLFMNCDRRCICSGAAVSCLQKHRDLVAKSPFPLTSGISRSNCDKPRLVWPECSKVWCCYVWINHQVGWRVRWSVSVTACRPPTTPAFTFCLETTCLQSIDGVLVTSVVVKISHNDLWSSGVQNPLNPAEWGALCLKTTTVLLIVIRLCGHLEELSMWLLVIHMTDYQSIIANVESCIFGSHDFCHGAHWMEECVEILVLAGGRLEEKFKRWPHQQQHNYTPSPLPSSEAGISTWSANNETQTL